MLFHCSAFEMPNLFSRSCTSFFLASWPKKVNLVSIFVYFLAIHSNLYLDQMYVENDTIPKRVLDILGTTYLVCLCTEIIGNVPHT
jgi:hypothetical protein